MFESLLIITGTKAPTLRRPCSQTDPELPIYLPTIMTTEETNGSEPQDLVLLLWTAERCASSFWLKSPSICQAQWPRPGVLLLMLSLSLSKENLCSKEFLLFLSPCLELSVSDRESLIRTINGGQES